jgi:hypothetical protein
MTKERDLKIADKRGWNECRAALLAAAPQPKEGANDETV